MRAAAFMQMLVARDLPDMLVKRHCPIGRVDLPHHVERGAFLAKFVGDDRLPFERGGVFGIEHQRPVNRIFRRFGLIFGQQALSQTG